MGKSQASMMQLTDKYMQQLSQLQKNKWQLRCGSV